MPKTRLFAALSFAALIPVMVAGQALAQAQTGTGGGPTSTITAPNTSSVGQTKPPGSAAGATTPDDRRSRTSTEKKDDEIQRGICIGCGAK